MHELVCIGCRSSFTPTRRNQEHCSVRCRQRAKRDKERAKRDGDVSFQATGLVSIPEHGLVMQKEKSMLLDVPLEKQAMALYGAALAQEWVLAHGGYLELPQVLQAVADDDLFLLARPCGFDGYMEMTYLFDANTLPVYVPLHMQRIEVFTFVMHIIHLQDPRLAVLAPLTWRVGYALGWLTGLRLHQPDEAQAGLVGLSMLIRPLLLSEGQTPRLNADFVLMSACQEG